MGNPNPLLAAIDIGNELRMNSDNTYGIDNVWEYRSIGSFISSILPNIYIITGIIVFIIIVISGLFYIINAGKGDEKAMETSQKALTAAIIGLVIIFVSFWIIQIIEVITGFRILNRS